MDGEFVKSTGPELRLNLPSKHLERKSLDRNDLKDIQPSHEYFEQGGPYAIEPNSGCQQCISPLSIQDFRVSYGKTEKIPPNKSLSNRVSLDVRGSQAKENKRTPIQQKSQKYLRDLNNSIANLASKRVSNGHSSSDNGATSYFMAENNETSELRRSKSPEYHRQQDFYGSKTPNNNSSNLSKFSETAKHTKSTYLFANRVKENANSPSLNILRNERDSSQNFNCKPSDDKLNFLYSNNKVAKNYGHHYQCNSYPVETEQPRGPVQKNLTDMFYTITEKVERNGEIFDSNIDERKFNHLQVDGSSPVQIYKERNAICHANGTSSNSLNLGANLIDPRFSEYAEQLKVEDLKLPASKTGKVKHGNIQKPSIKNYSKQMTDSRMLPQNHTPLGNSRDRPPSIKVPVSSTSVNTATVLKTEPSRSTYIIYDMHERILRHSKQYLDAKPRDVKVINEEIKQEEINKEALKNRSFRGAMSKLNQQNENISEDDNSFDHLDLDHISDGVVYQAGGVGIGRTRVQRSSKGKQKPQTSKKILGDELIKEALKIKNDMAKRKRDYVEVKQFLTLANRDARYSKAGESCGNISEKNFGSVSTSNAFLLPTTAVSTQGNQQIAMSKPHQSSRIRATSITRRVVTCGDVSAFDPEESHHKRHPHDPIQTESNQIYFQTEANTGESVYELRMEQDYSNHACCYPKKTCGIF